MAVTGIPAAEMVLLGPQDGVPGAERAYDWCAVTGILQGGRGGILLVHPLWWDTPVDEPIGHRGGLDLALKRAFFWRFPHVFMSHHLRVRL